MRPLAIATVVPVAVMVLGGGACAPRFEGRTRLEAIEPQVVSSCDADDVSLAFDVAYDAADGAYSLVGMTVDDLGPTCLGRQLVVSLGDASGEVLGTASSEVTDTSVDLVIDPIVPPIDEDLGFRVGDVDVEADDVAIIRVDITG